MNKKRPINLRVNTREDQDETILSLKNDPFCVQEEDECKTPEFQPQKENNIREQKSPETTADTIHTASRKPPLSFNLKSVISEKLSSLRKSTSKKTEIVSSSKQITQPDE